MDQEEMSPETYLRLGEGVVECVIIIMVLIFQSHHQKPDSLQGVPDAG